MELNYIVKAFLRIQIKIKKIFLIYFIKYLIKKILIIIFNSINLLTENLILALLKIFEYNEFL